MTSSLFSSPVNTQNALNRRARGAANGWRLELLYLAVAAVELLWWLPWLLLIVPGGAAVPAVQIALWAGANFLGALLLTRVLTRRRVDDTWLRAAFLAGIVFALWLTFSYVLPLNSLGSQPPAIADGKLFFPPPVLIILLVLWFWYRGQTLASSTVTPARAGFGFRVGIIALIGAALIANDRLQHAVLLLLPFFFFTGLSANSLARAASLRVSRDMQRSSFGLGWISFVVLIGATLSAIGFIGGIVLGGAKFDTMLGAAHNVFDTVMGFFAAILLPIMGWLAQLIDSFFGQIHAPVSKIIALNTQFGNVARNAGPPTATATMLLNMAPYICGGGGLVLIVVIVLLMLRRQSRRFGQNGEERETLDNAAILSSLRAAAQRAIDNALDALANFSLGGGGMNAFTVRRLYARLCRLAGERGYPRGSDQTPDEYRLVLRQAFPTFGADIDQVTRAYVNVHYGESTDDPAVIATARTLCDQIAALKDA
jgi:multisubunit Na+/H+ antiporter MnhG subunit